MRKSTIVDLKRFKLLQSIGANKILLLLCTLLFAGILIGTLSYGTNNEILNMSSKLLADFTKHHSSMSFGKILITSFMSSTVFLLAMFACGTSMLGVVLSPLLVLFLGFRYGCLSAYLYSAYGIKGIAFCAVLLIPPAVIYIIGLLFAAKYSIALSCEIAKLTFPKYGVANLCDSFKVYCAKYAVIIFVILLSSVLDAVLSKFFYASLIL